MTSQHCHRSLLRQTTNSLETQAPYSRDHLAVRSLSGRVQTVLAFTALRWQKAPLPPRRGHLLAYLSPANICKYLICATFKSSNLGAVHLGETASGCLCNQGWVCLQRQQMPEIWKNSPPSAPSSLFCALPSYRGPRSHEILTFVCVQKYVKQWRNVKKLECTRVN